MDRRTEKKSSLDSVFVLTVFTLFVCCLLFAVLTYAGVYKSTGERINERFNNATTVSFITRKLQSYDMAGAISVRTLEGKSVLCLDEELDGEQYTTYIYHSDGYLYELFTSSHNSFDETAGNQLLKCDYFDIRLSGQNVSFEIKNGDNITTSTVTLRCEAGEAV